MPSFYERIVTLFYAKPLTVHEQRLACFKNLAAIQERTQKAESSKDETNTVVTEYNAEYERCEPIMKMQ